MSLFHNNASSPLSALDDVRVKRIRPLIPPQILIEDYPLTIEAAATIAKGRQEAEAIVKQQDDRIIVVVGPCSVHDVVAGLEYGESRFRLRRHSENTTRRRTEQGASCILSLLQQNVCKLTQPQQKMICTSSCVSTLRSHELPSVGRV